MEDLIASFNQITNNADDAQARFFLESSQNDLQGAIEAFFNQDQAGDVPAAVPQQFSPPPPPQQQQQPPPQRQQPPASAKPASSAKPRVATFADLRGGGDDDDDEEDEEDKAPEFYTGGKSSGMAVQGHGKEKKGKEGQGLFDAARKAGATDAEPEGTAPAAKKAFQGQGMTLGGPSTESRVVGQAPPSAAAPAPAPRLITLTLWKTGFTIDDGEAPPTLMAFQDNQPLLNSIMTSIQRQEIPAVFRKYGDIELALKDNRAQDFVPPKPIVKPFSGSGFRLGAPTGDATVAPPPVAATAPAVVNAAAAAPPPPSSCADPSLPSTKLQLRLADGTRLVAQFNNTQTVLDVRKFISSARPGEGRPFVLMTAFPKQSIDDETLTLQEAGLLNAVIIQTYKN